MISTHILDTSLGTPAAGVSVSLEQKVGAEWTLKDRQLTNSDGRIAFQGASEKALYRLVFDVEPYFQNAKLVPFFTTVPVIFNVTDTNRKYHVPLLLNPYGYSTYRGS